MGKYRFNLKRILSTGSIFIRVFMLALLLSFSIYTIFLLSHRNEHISVQKEESKRLLQTKAEIISDYYRNLVYDVKLLSGLSSLHNFLDNNKNKTDLAFDFSNYSKNLKVFDQVRFLDASGMEIIRVNLIDGQPVLVPEEQLQEKTNRYYFTDTIRLQPGQVYISLFDLNIENKQIEIPRKPMIRIGSPVYHDGEKEGAVILNYLGRNILDEFQKTTDLQPGSFYLANKDGDWLYRNEPGMEWGFMFPEKEIVSFIDECPEVWSALQDEDFFQLHHDKRLVSALRITPYESFNFIDAVEDSWLLIHSIENDEFGLGPHDYGYRYMFYGILILVLDIVSSIIISRIIMERNNYRSSMEHAAMYDNLTDLPNRYLIYDRLNRQLELADRYHFNLAVCFIDLDGFKDVNDTFGHDVGDLLLQSISIKIKSVLRSSDTVGRYGGDEFIILLPRISSENECDIVTNKILKAIDEKLLIEGNEISIGASIGISMVEGGRHETIEQILQEADAAMYNVKKAGKNAIAYFTD